MIRFEILGQPIAKQRPRVTRSGIAYTPAKTVNYETLVKYTYQSTYGHREPISGYIEANITAVFPVPKSYSKKKTAELLNGNNNYDKKPDCDNLAKIILDSLNGLAYKDDSQVTALHVNKEYGTQPKVIVTLKEIEK
jgi:Holliday junction resolvase RusA-like endonuclease